MAHALLRLALIALCLSPVAASAEVIKLKLAYFSSDRTMRFKSVVEPFVEAVNAEGRGLVRIEVSPASALGKALPEQAQYVTDGVADIAFIIPGYKTDIFPDNGVIALPGLFRDFREASLVFTRMVAANALSGYENFVVITAVTAEPAQIHTRRPVASLADLKDLKIRASSQTEAAALDKLGMRGAILPINQMVDDITAGAIDGAAAPILTLPDFGIGRVTRYHYMLNAGTPPLLVVMSRAKFESLPERAQNLIRKYSGEWTASRSVQLLEEFASKTFAGIAADPQRKVVYPSPADAAVIQSTFSSVIAEWLARHPRNRELLTIAEAEIAKVRVGQ